MDQQLIAKIGIASLVIIVVGFFFIGVPMMVASDNDAKALALEQKIAGVDVTVLSVKQAIDGAVITVSVENHNPTDRVVNVYYEIHDGNGDYVGVGMIRDVNVPAKKTKVASHIEYGMKHAAFAKAYVG